MKKSGLLLVLTIAITVSITIPLVSGAFRVHAQQSTPNPPAAPSTAPPAQTANPAQPSAAPVAVFQAQAKLVLVDSIVTDKKGDYVRDLTQKDFRVWEDNKEQEIKTFSYESESSPNNPSKHYLVLFFDNSTMDFGDQARARDAAAKFIDANTGPNRLIALVDFGGTLRVTQNFTADPDLLKKVVAGTKFSTVSPNAHGPEVASLGAPPLGNAEADFGARSMLLAIRDLAKNLGSVPGRKILVLLTSGFPLTPERQSELTAVIDACNKANVAIYPIDVRGLITPDLAPVPGRGPHSGLTTPATHHAQLVTAVLTYSSDAEPTPHLVYVQHTGGGTGGGGTGGGGTGGGSTGGGGGHSGGGGGSTGGGGTSGGGHGGGGGGSTGGGGSRGGGGYSGLGNYYNNPNFQPRNIVPQFPASATTNQQVLFALADGTGGFVIHDTNDLLSGMERIAKEQNEYYILGYTPPDSEESSCHTLKVKIDLGGTTVRSRSGYCNVQPADLLAGKPIERELESHAARDQAGSSGSLETPFFFTSPNVARVSLAMEVPSSSIKFEKQKGKFHSDVNVLGIATRSAGGEAARFSDTVHLEFDKKELEEFQKKPFTYQNQFDVASGEYKLTVVFSAGGESFGKLETSLKVDSYDGKRFDLSSLALSREVHPVSQLADGMDADLIAGNVPLVTGGVEVVPAADYHFKKTEPAFVYMEIYEPLLAGSNPPKVGVEMTILDSKTGAAPVKLAFMANDHVIQPGNPVVPLGLKVPVDKLDPGSYRLELHALDSAGNSSTVRSSEFEVD
jgi:VWFA-related protein